MANVIYDEMVGAWSIMTMLRRHSPSKVFVIADNNAPYKILEQSNGQALAVDYTIVPDVKEIDKSMTVVLDIVSKMAALELDRDAIVLAVGGGMTLDVAGFAASIYLRGLKTVYYPTTLLAMVDAAHGGKTGVNYNGAKNQLGTFHMPEATIVNVDLIDDMPELLIRDGLVETVKHWYVDGARSNVLNEGVRELFTHPASFKRDKIKKYSEFFSWQDDACGLIKSSIDVKLSIVEQDATENVAGGRELLNFGHTFGHAFEVVNELSHGAGVLFGMMVAFELGVRENLIDRSMAHDHMSSLATMLTDEEKRRVYSMTREHIDLVLKDKKIKGDMISLILPKRNGKNVELVPTKIQTRFLQNLCTMEVFRND